jgi:hypothetical protein
MQPTAPLRKSVQCVCYDTLPWLISFSLGWLSRVFRHVSVLLERTVSSLDIADKIRQISPSTPGVRWE